MSRYNNQDRNEAVCAMRRDGVGPREIARRLGLSASVVAGALYRAGMTNKVEARGADRPVRIKQPRQRIARRKGSRTRRRHSPEAYGKARELYLAGETYSKIAAATGIPVGTLGQCLADLPRRRPVTWDVKPKPRSFRLEALALIAGGVSARQVAKRLGVNPITLRNWRRDSSLVAQADAIGAQVKAEAQARRDEVAARKSAAKAARRDQRDAHNAPILTALRLSNPKHAKVCEYLLADHSLAEAGEHFGFTRERARQIVAYAVAKYGLDTEGRFVGKPPKAMMTEGKREAKRRENFERLMKLAAEAGERIGRECMA